MLRFGIDLGGTKIEGLTDRFQTIPSFSSKHSRAGP
jgi:hypothetical protein